MERTLLLLERDPDLGAEIPGSGHRERARRALRVPELRLAPGQTLDPRAIEESASLGALIVHGYLVREVSLNGRISADLIGPEDLVETRGSAAVAELITHHTTWTALTDTVIAPLGLELAERWRAWPEVGAALLERGARPAQRLALGRAIATLPSVDARLLTQLWLWASCWSTVTADGPMLSVPLSHERLARLIGARRPTVTAAVGRLRRAHYLGPRVDGGWLLSAAEPQLDRDGASAPLTVPALESLSQPATLGVRSARGRPNAASREMLHRELRARLAEQQAVLRAHAARNQAALAELRAGSRALVAHGSALADTRRRLRGGMDRNGSGERDESAVP